MILQRTILDPISGVCILVGQGAPTLDAPTGSVYIRRDGTENNTIYSKYGNGTGDWAALGSVASGVDWSSLTNIPSNLVSGSSQVDHNATTNYVANQHVDHSTVSISAGNGLSGGGNITATRTLTLDTGSAHFTNGVRAKLNADNIYPSSTLVGIGITPLAKFHVNDGTNRNLLVTTDASQQGTTGIAIGSFNDAATGYAPLSIVGSVIAINNDVGIGTIAPNAKLSVNGNANITGSLGVTSGIDLLGSTSGIVSLKVPAAAGSNTITFPASTGTVALTSQLPSVNNGTLTVQGSGGVTGTGTFTANQSTNATITLSHADTSTLTGIQGTNGIASITVDSLGHVTAVDTATYVDTSNNQTVGGNKTFSGDVLIADKIVHSGDTNTAIRFPSADTFTVETSGTERIRVTSTGLVGIGVSPSYNLHVSGSIYATENITAYSDGRIKENVVTIDNALDKVDKMRGVYYTRVDSDGTERHVGVIAQEMLEIVPELVSYAQDIDQYGVKYQNITALLIQAIKELKAEVDELKRNK